VSESPQWYDSVWLGMFLAARRIVADVAPERLDAFVAAFAPLRTDPGFAVRRLPQLFGGAGIRGGWRWRRSGASGVSWFTICRFSPRCRRS
jgi:hypothetical protein